jgi:heterodisulfide reductase subunit B
MKIAPYYGCQILRPYPVFDEPGKPVSMEPFIEAMGGEVFEWFMGNRCCGASLIMGHPEVAVKSVAAILSDAAGADAIVTVCPLCQMNLEAYQDKAVKEGGKAVPVLYLTQLMGVALGLSQDAMQLEKNLTLTARVRNDISARSWAVPDPAEGETAGASGSNLKEKGASHV